MKKIASIYLLIILMISCVCPPDIDTRKTIEPTEFANVLFIHALPDGGNYYIYSWTRPAKKNLNYYDTSYSYVEVGSGSGNLSIVQHSDSSVVYNAPLDFEKDKYYTLVFYGSESEIFELLMPDSVETFDPNNAYVRFIHVSPNTPAVDVSLYKDFKISLNLDYAQNSRAMALATGNYTLDIADKATGNSLLPQSFEELKPGKLYNVILRGYNSDTKPRKLEWLVVEVDFATTK